MADTQPGTERADMELLHYLTQPKRANLVQDLIGHPMGSPSLDELDFHNPEQSKSTIRNHLDGLIHNGLVEKVTHSNEAPGLPSNFFRLTDQARGILDRYRIFPSVEEMKKTYASVEKPERIMRHETAPRPREIFPDIEGALAAGHLEIEDVEGTETTGSAEPGPGTAIALTRDSEQ